LTDISLLGRSIADGVATLTLQNPGKLNSLSIELQRALLAELSKLREDRSVRALVLTGSGSAFCAGADLQEMQQAAAAMEPSIGEWLARMMAGLTNPIVQALREMPVPVVCAVNGAAVGAGAGLALAGDIVLMARSAYFYLPFVPRLGLVPDMGTTWLLPRRIGRARAVAMTLLGERVGAEQALQWGLAWGCSDDDRLAADAAALAGRLAALPGDAALETRMAYDASERNDLPGQLAYEARRQRDLIERAPFAEGVRAFLEKREPNFNARDF
jgi:2-(1,2-epoxy-1,2-dihydrophenyl)acetyl-CoA isomerase